MTIRDGTTGEPGTPKAADGRVRRPQARRTGPERAATGSALDGTQREAPADPAGPRAHDETVSESVAHAVKTAYDVLAENIRQGREAAERFRQGEYNIRDVPVDLEAVVGRLIYLAREMSGATLDVCERLLKEVGSFQPPADRSGVPPFRAPAATPKAPPAAAAPTDPGRMKLTVCIKGASGALTRTDMLNRPCRPTQPQDITASPLSPRAAGGGTITEVTFRTDVSIEGLVADVTIPDGLAAGVYSGLVRAEHDDVPLGVLSIEIPK